MEGETQCSGVNSMNLKPRLAVLAVAGGNMVGVVVCSYGILLYLYGFTHAAGVFEELQ